MSKTKEKGKEHKKPSPKKMHEKKEMSHVSEKRIKEYGKKKK